MQSNYSVESQGATDKKTSSFRIVATGVILGLDKTIDVVKKLKLTGTPYKIFKNTAFLKGMFSSILEVPEQFMLYQPTAPWGIVMAPIIRI